MGVTDHLKTDESAPETDHSTTKDERDDQPDDGAIDPFSFGYDTELYEVYRETVDQGLSLVIALANLL